MTVCRALGLDVGQTTCHGTASFESSRALGDIWALTQLWEGLGLHRLGAAFRQRSRHRVDLEALLRVMVFNRYALRQCHNWAFDPGRLLPKFLELIGCE